MCLLCASIKWEGLHNITSGHSHETESSAFIMRVKLGRLAGSASQHSFMTLYTASGHPSGASMR